MKAKRTSSLIPPSEEVRSGSLRDHFLIAMPAMADGNFSEALVYICDHSKEGAMGLVINRPMEASLSTVFEQMQLDGDTTLNSQPLLSGGPVSVERGFVLHSGDKQSWESTMKVSPQVSLTASRDIIADMAAGNGPSDALVVLGYAGWGPGQLEQEIAENAWLTVPADSDIIFRTPFAERNRAAAASIGVNLQHLSHGFGRA
ncbi:MAG: YqgE/AlgH family protein [Porticoccaceae bacterium]|nr:YqgE/AlgH family protein [Porticoccaceae bacterium]